MHGAGTGLIFTSFALMFFAAGAFISAGSNKAVNRKIRWRLMIMTGVSLLIAQYITIFLGFENLSKEMSIGYPAQAQYLPDKMTCEVLLSKQQDNGDYLAWLKMKNGLNRLVLLKEEPPQGKAMIVHQWELVVGKGSIRNEEVTHLVPLLPASDKQLDRPQQ